MRVISAGGGVGAERVTPQTAKPPTMSPSSTAATSFGIATLSTTSSLGGVRASLSS